MENTDEASTPSTSHRRPSATSSIQHYDYLLKFILVGDACKNDILSHFSDGSTETFYHSNVSNVHYRTYRLCQDGRVIKIKVWDSPSQGRFSSIFRYHARGCQGVLLVFDITKRWSFEAMSDWLEEVDRYAPGTPKLLVGNNLHSAYNRRVSSDEAKSWASSQGMPFFQVSALSASSVRDCFASLTRLSIHQSAVSQGKTYHGTVLSLRDLCALAVLRHCTQYSVEHLPVPDCIKGDLRHTSFAVTSAFVDQQTLVDRKRAELLRIAGASPSNHTSSSSTPSCLHSSDSPSSTPPKSSTLTSNLSFKGGPSSSKSSCPSRKNHHKSQKCNKTCLIM